MGLKVAGLFAGIGGIELGLKRAGHETVLNCELDPGARRVLESRFPGVEVAPDVTELDSLPAIDLVAAGFPCQDLSQAGGKTGIQGAKSGVVEHLFRLLETAGHEKPSWVLIENVSYMLRLDRGRGMAYLVDRLEACGYSWAYRVIDARAFGIPQRRQRVLLLAGRDEDPGGVILRNDAGDPGPIDSIGAVDKASSYGFYWTEGRRGLGWALDAIPTLKGGSRIGIPSPPAIWTPNDGTFGTPSLEDSERLQGFPRNWTEPADEVFARPRRFRWSLVGNAVCVPVAEWIGKRLTVEPGKTSLPRTPLPSSGRWPTAACGSPGGERYAVEASMRPAKRRFVPLNEFLTDPLTPLSHRAASGFLSRTSEGRLRFGDGFIEDLEHYVARGPAEKKVALAA
jgi:DNA (cytosine-5)-methyltransferase 1